jgi:hypothetical protein
METCVVLIVNFHQENKTVNNFDAGEKDSDDCDMFPTIFPATYTMNVTCWGVLITGQKNRYHFSENNEAVELLEQKIESK